MSATPPLSFLRTPLTLVALFVAAAQGCSDVTEPPPPPQQEFSRGLNANRSFEVVDLGTLAGTRSLASAINERGDIAGSTLVEAEDCFPGALRSHAFLWTAEDGMRDLGTGSGEPCEDSFAADLNNRREVVGQTFFAGGPELAPFFWSEKTGMHLILEPEELVFSGHAHSISNRSHVAAETRATVGANPNQDFGLIWHPKRGVIQSWTDFFPREINSRGQMAGSQNGQPVLMWRGTVQHLPFFPTDLNERGDVLGSDGIWTEKAGVVGQGGLAFNDHREVVGQETFSGESHAFYWSKQTGVIDLGTLGGSWSIAHDISNRGWIVGAAETATGEVHATLWKPSP